MNICIITFGTRGDVQPYIALGVSLRAAGHAVTIAVLVEFKSLVIDYGLQHDTLRGGFLKAAQTAEGKSALERRGNPLKLLRQYVAMARETLDDEWASAQKAEVLVYNSAALGGFHIAEKMGIPAFACFPMPLYSPTREFPSPMLPFRNLGPFNKLSHRVFAALGRVMYRRPIMGDQSFWGRRVAALGVGPAPIPRRQLTAAQLADAIRKAVTDNNMRQCAALLGETIRTEDGIGYAVASINNQLSSE